MTFIDHNLPAPQVDGVVDGNLDPDSLSNTGTRVRISNVPTRWGRALLTLYLQDSEGSILHEIRWPVGLHGRDIKLPLSRALLSKHRGKEVRLRYEVSGIGASLPLDFKLEEAFSDSVEQNLPAPQLDGVVDGNLDPDSLPDTGTTARISNVPTSWGGALLTLYLQDSEGSILHEIRWPVGPYGRDIKLPLSRTLLSEHRGKEVRLRYEVSGIGASLPLDFKLEEAFSGSVELDLAAYAYMVLYTHSIARPPADIPQFATLHRMQPGATAYSSDNEAVAKVDAQGTVTVQGNGLVTITASGAPSGPGSYRLTITGIEEFHILSSEVDWEGAQALCVATGCVLPTGTDFARLKYFYHLPVGDDLPDLPLWGALLGAGTALTLNLVSGELGGADVSDILQGAGIRQPGRVAASIATSVRSGALETHS